MLFDPNYDPYEHLQHLENLVQQLISANNHCQQALMEITSQHRNLIAVIKQHKSEIADLRRRLDLSAANTYFNSHNNQGQH
jgi:hypothetical protein